MVRCVVFMVPRATGKRVSQALNAYAIIAGGLINQNTVLKHHLQRRKGVCIKGIGAHGHCIVVFQQPRKIGIVPAFVAAGRQAGLFGARQSRLARLQNFRPSRQAFVYSLEMRCRVKHTRPPLHCPVHRFPRPDRHHNRSVPALLPVLGRPSAQCAPVPSHARNPA